jgi:uncharacterized protein
MILCDTSGLIALLDHDDINHTRVIPYSKEHLIVPVTVLCEVDYFISKYLGDHVARQFMTGQGRNEWTLLGFEASDLERANEIRAEYADLRIGFVDASLIALAERHRLSRLLTLDRRHLAVVRPRKLELELLP